MQVIEISGGGNNLCQNRATLIPRPLDFFLMRLYQLLMFPLNTF